jgi:hypothetical protein
MGGKRRPASSLSRFSAAIRGLWYGALDCQTHIIAVHDRKLLFYAVPKAANTSVKAILSDHIQTTLPRELRSRVPGQNTGGTLFRKDRRPLMYEAGILLCKHQAAALSGYTGFAFVRNPWDRLVSCYANKLTRSQLAKDPQGRGTLRSLARAGALSEDMSFADFARAVASISDKKANRHFRSQYTFLVGRRGRLMPQRILKFERFEEDLRAILSEFKLEKTEVPHKKPTRRGDYREYYDTELKELVASRYARDIELFGYSF